MKCNECGKEMKGIKGKPYHYVESGLDNVYLLGVPVYKCTCGETMVEVPNVEELHKAIAAKILQKPSLLRGKEIRFIRKQMKLKAVELTEQLGISEITLSRWENNAESIGPANDKLLRLIFLLRYVKDLDVPLMIMRKYVERATQIATMRQLRQRGGRIFISDKDLQRGAGTEPLLSGVS
jgi:putative zinc finger/helix-turn-helix YgiT family protein